MNGSIFNLSRLGLLFLAIAFNSANAQDYHSTCSCNTGPCDASYWRCDGIGCDCGRHSCDDQNCWTQSTLTGDWCGLRNRLRESGITFKGTVTQFAFGIDGGINNLAVPAPFGQGDTFKYTGRGEYDLILDFEKIGGLPCGKLLVGAQHWWGEFGNVSFNTGALAPAVLPAIAPPTPNDPGDLVLTDFLFTLPISERLVAFVGKKNVVGTADQDIFAGGDGTDQFMNQALLANPAYLLALPYSSFTAGVVMPREWGLATLYVWDPQDRTDAGLNLDGLFSDGIIVGTQLKVNTNLHDLPGEHHVGGLWKHIDQVDLSLAAPPANGFPNQAVAPGLPTLSDAYTIYYGFDQYFALYPGERRSSLPQKPPRGWGLFGRASISDGNPTPYQFFLSAGVGGDTRFGNDRGDTFGLGWYYTGVTDKFGPIPRTLFGPRDGTGVELFYKFQVTPWFAVTPDLQFIRPGFSNFTSGDDAVVFGIRANVNL